MKRQHTRIKEIEGGRIELAHLLDQRARLDAEILQLEATQEARHRTIADRRGSRHPGRARQDPERAGAGFRKRRAGVGQCRGFRENFTKCRSGQTSRALGGGSSLERSRWEVDRQDQPGSEGEAEPLVRRARRGAVAGSSCRRGWLGGRGYAGQRCQRPRRRREGHRGGLGDSCNARRRRAGTSVGRNGEPAGVVASPARFPAGPSVGVATAEFSTAPF